MRLLGKFVDFVVSGSVVESSTEHKIEGLVDAIVNSAARATNFCFCTRNFEELDRRCTHSSTSQPACYLIYEGADFTLRRFASRLLELAALELWNLLIFVIMTFAASMFF